MALGKRTPQQQPLFVPTAGLPALRPHPYYDAVNKVFDAHGFDAFVETACSSFYKGDVGRPGLPPGVYFRCLMIGYLEGPSLTHQGPNAASPGGVPTPIRSNSSWATRSTSRRRTTPRSRVPGG